MASFNKKGPRSGLSRDDSSMRSSCSVFLEGLIFGLEKEGDGSSKINGFFFSETKGLIINGGGLIPPRFYLQVFVRDFVPTGLACLMKEPPEPEIVRNFLLKTLHLQGSYIKRTRDYALLDRPEVQNGMKLILKLCLSDGFDTFPTLLCADGCSMIDRRM
ncbi:hypothetical protein NC651_006626 [Populus alba x Populus x berolinensis]|nr:hypothetical protein NC651_006626 [Populus alba x Populus x berolinensis]